MSDPISIAIEYFPQLLKGLWVSVLLLASLVGVGTPLAFLAAIGLRSRFKILRWTLIAIIEFARGIPSLIMLYLIYFGMPSVGLTLTSFVAATIALSINYIGYVSDTMRSGIDSIPRGQLEAASALGLNRWHTVRFVTIPQSFRIITPPLLSWIIVYFQTTAIAFTIAVPELMSAAYSIASKNFQYLTLFILVGMIYAAFSIPGSQLVAALERRSSKSSV
ncbi:amino acid ABC transporter permease [Leucobacter denitrificans]|uniref:Amino acid ABC transporter permease n=1 Tax=Leucobacter denitrificans TaxID=683042 RepID=A0A7G9S2B5_9MICO|nr:amino acid ABC transporter permease [Leucobacter denitrificans]QNN61990.1 amino acid ABC transporter permease [Leucobacter denitrificans]